MTEILFFAHRYEVYYTKRPNAQLKHWIMRGVDPTDRQLVVDWTRQPSFTEVAPVLYWKVRLVGFVNEGPFSETKVFKCLPGGRFLFFQVSAQFNLSGKLTQKVDLTFDHFDKCIRYVLLEIIRS